MALTKINNNTLSAVTTLPSAIATGTVLQVVQAKLTTEASTTSTSYASTNLTAAITPSATSSKILVLVSQNVQMERQTFEIVTVVQLLRGSTSISVKAVGVGTGAANGQGGRDVVSIVNLDSPSTTDAITYKTQGKLNTTANSATCRFQEAGAYRSEITLIEIAG